MPATHEQQPVPQASPAADGRADPVYVNGHHGAAKLEHAISKSYSSITRMLEVMPDDPLQAVSKFEAAPTMQPVMPAVASVRLVRPLRAPDASVSLAQTSQPQQAAVVPAKTRLAAVTLASSIQQVAPQQHAATSERPASAVVQKH